MERHDDGAATFVPELQVASALAHLFEAELPEGLDGLAAGDDRQPLGQALSSRVEMIGASISVGRGWSS